MSKHVVILGAGYAGLRALKFLQKGNEDFNITLIDRNDYHYEATDLHEVAAGIQPAERISYPIKDVVDKTCTTFIQGVVEKVNAENKTVQLSGQSDLSYDYLIVSLGFQSECFGIPGANEYALQMVDINTSKKIYEHLQEQMRLYKETKNEELLKIVVCGAGFTGIELLGSLVEGKKALAEIAGVSPDQIQLYCVEAVTRLLPMFSEKLANYAVDLLKKWGVTFLTGKPIKEIKPGAVLYAENAESDTVTSLEAKTIIWTTGVSGSKVVGESGFEERRGRVMVTENLTDANHEEVYILGDCSAVMDPQTNRPWPTTAQIAMKMGQYAAQHIQAKESGKAIPAFTFKPQGSVCSVGNAHAMGVVGKTEVKGYPASFIKKMIMNKSLFETGGIKELLAKGRFDLYH